MFVLIVVAVAVVIVVVAVVGLSVVVVVVIVVVVVVVVGISVVVGVSVVVVVVFFRLRTSKIKLISKGFGGFVTVLRDFLFSDDNFFQLVKYILLFNKSKYSIKEMISSPDQDADQRKNY